MLPYLGDFASPQSSTDHSISFITRRQVCGDPASLLVTSSTRGDLASQEEARSKRFVMLTHYSINRPMGVNPPKAGGLVVQIVISFLVHPNIC